MSAHPPSRPPSTAQASYATRFTADEAPLSQGGRWINGKATGIDWTDVRTIAGRACGHQPPRTNVADNTAILGGIWAPDQTVTVTAYNQLSGHHGYPEMEIRLRSALSAKLCTGYEVCYSAKQANDAYLGIIRWNGPYNDYTIIEQKYGPQYIVRTGDTLKATIIGNVITAYVNGRLLLQVTDDVYKHGSPGIGFDQSGGEPDLSSWGFTSFAIQVT